MFQKIKDRWHRPSGYRDVLLIAFPLILSTGAWSLQNFVDRMFLTWYSPEAIAAAMPAGILNFTFMSLFIGAAGYVSTFIAQYYGADQQKQIGPMLWQGLYLAIIGAIFIACTVPFSEGFFTLFKHEPEIMAQEVIYYDWLAVGSFFAIGNAVLSGLFSGIGKTKPVMWVNFAAIVVNLVLDYLLIFGHFGFPEWGIMGAAIATNIGTGFGFILFIYLILKHPKAKQFGVKVWQIDRKRLKRLAQFGLPNGMQFFLDVSGFTFFVLLIGYLGKGALAASNIAFTINTLGFLPMIGISTSVSIMVGQQLGRKNPQEAVVSTYSAFHLTLLYMLFVSIFYLVIPEQVIAPFLSNSSGGDLDPVQLKDDIVILLRFVALYSIFDAFNLIFAGAIKGAGDTRFVMYINATVSLLFLILPTYMAVYHWNWSLYNLWWIIAGYVGILACIFTGRFLGGKWQRMRVIEDLGA